MLCGIDDNVSACGTSTAVALPFARMRKRVTLDGFEIRTYRVDTENRTWTEVDLTESSSG